MNSNTQQSISAEFISITVLPGGRTVAANEISPSVSSFT